jgi:hypothetical protein
MANILLAAYLILVGIGHILDRSLPPLLTGLLALGAGVLLLLPLFNAKFGAKK